MLSYIASMYIFCCEGVLWSSHTSSVGTVGLWRFYFKLEMSMKWNTQHSTHQSHGAWIYIECLTRIGMIHFVCVYVCVCVCVCVSVCVCVFTCARVFTQAGATNAWPVNTRFRSKQGRCIRVCLRPHRQTRVSIATQTDISVQQHKTDVYP